MQSKSKTPVKSIKTLEGAEKPPLNWEGGKREAPSNRGEGDRSSAAGREFPNGNRGEASGKNLEHQAAVSGTQGKP